MAKTMVAKGSRLQAANEVEGVFLFFTALMFISLGGCRGRSTVALLILFVFIFGWCRLCARHPFYHPYKTTESPLAFR